MIEKGCYVREGTSAKPLIPEEIKRRYEAILNIQRLTILTMASYHQNLTFSVLRIYLKRTLEKEIDPHLRTMLRIIIWKQWKVPRKGNGD